MSAQSGSPLRMRAIGKGVGFAQMIKRPMQKRLVQFLLACSLQQKLHEPFLHWSFDHLRESHALPMARIRNGELDWALMRPAIFDGFHRSLPAFAKAGNNLIVDHIIEQEQWMADLLRLLAPFDVFFVGVHCPLPELERRERHRGDRRVAEARTDFHSVHRFTEYDFDVDATQPTDGNVERLITAWQSRCQPTAFERMAAAEGWRGRALIVSR